MCDVTLETFGTKDRKGKETESETKYKITSGVWVTDSGAILKDFV